MAPALNGGVWVGSKEAGLGRIDEQNVFHPRAALAGGVVSALLEDNHGMLWVGTFGSGLYRMPVNGGSKAGPGAALSIAKRPGEQPDQQLV